MHRSSRTFLLFFTLFATSLLLSGCSFLVSSELDSKDADGGPRVIPDGGDVDSGCDPMGATDECVVDGDCGSPLMTCTDAACGYSRCECPLGYARGDVGDAGVLGCVWVGFVDEPGFVDGTPWTAAGDAALNTGSSGNVDPGVAEYDTFATCNGDGVGQSITIPARAQFHPINQVAGFVLESTYRGTATSSDPYGGGNTPSPRVAIGNGTQDFPPGLSTWETNRLCLGESIFDATWDFDVLSHVGGADCSGSSTYSLDVDSINIVPAMMDECPEVGTAANGNMEGDFGWTADGCYAANGQAFYCEYSAGTGASSSRSYYLGVRRGCSHAGVRGRLSIPTATTLPNAAVEFWVTGTSPQNLPLTVSLAGQSIGSVIPPVSGSLQRMCVPAGAIGRVETLAFGVDTGGSCLFDRIADYYIDNVQFVSDVGCAP